MNTGVDCVIYNGNIYNFVRKKFSALDHTNFVDLQMDFMNWHYLNRVGSSGYISIRLHQRNINGFSEYLDDYLPQSERTTTTIEIVVVVLFSQLDELSCSFIYFL
ncbi:unnamed protein product [Trichobilharzia szidati]|nr:unnamed protein product [Trichobilharzia szidati]